MHVHVNGVELEYLDEGAGVPVVFSHGGSSDLRYWEPQRAVFAARYRFVAYSHRFHGRGQWSIGSENSADAHADDLVAIMRHLGAGPVHLVGFSTAIALRATLRDPEIVRTLTVVEPNVPWVLESKAEGGAVLAWWSEENQRVDAEAAGDPERRAMLWFDLVNNSGTGAFDVQPPALRRMWLDNFNRARPAAPPPEPLTC
jgi:pimeloyl-ACP methyl ester carboxylesterase